MDFLWFHWMLLLLSYGFITSGLNLQCDKHFVSDHHCVVQDLEVSNEHELRIEFGGNRTGNSTESLELYIKIQNSGFSTIPAEVFRLLQKLKRFSIYRSNMTFLSTDRLAPASKLERLTLNRCEISQVQPYAFSGFENISSLSLESNLLTHIQRYTFVDMPKLTELWLNNNSIQTIEDGAFNLTELQLLDISENKLTILSDSLFCSLHKLRKLIMSHNELTHIGHSMYLPTVQIIYLTDNKVEDIVLVEFVKMPLLRGLHLENSGFLLESQRTSDFENHSLIFLSLDDMNSIKSRDLKKLSVFKELKYIELRSISYTGFTLPTINIKSFLPKLEHITLQYRDVDCRIIAQLEQQMQEQGISIHFDC